MQLRQWMDEAVDVTRGGALDAEIRGAALLHLARVHTALDRLKANQLFDEGVALLSPVSTSGLDQLWRTERMLLLGAVVRPDRVRELVPLKANGPRGHYLGSLIRVMVDHGHAAEAAGYLAHPNLAAEQYPYLGALEIMGRFAQDASLKQSILSAARGAWRANRSPDFYRLIAPHWTVLPAEEMLAVLREVVDWIVSQPQQQIKARVGQEITFSQVSDLHLFELLPVLRRLAPDTADPLIASRPDLKRAAERFPLGKESMLEESQRQQRPGVQPGLAGAGFGGPADFHGMQRLMEAEYTGDIDWFSDEAMRLYAVDVDQADPNRACRECWPSTQMFRRAFHLAGLRLRESAFELLSRVPDPAIEFLSRIALLGALASLPELRLSQGFHRHNPSQGSR
jgi:hypothetical protein